MTSSKLTNNTSNSSIEELATQSVTITKVTLPGLAPSANEYVFLRVHLVHQLLDFSADSMQAEKA